MYNSKYLKVDNPSKKNLKNPSPQVSVPFESQEGFMNGLPPEGHHYRILGDTLFNPTPFPITAVANTGQVEKLLPFDTKPINFNGADHVDEYLDDDQIAELQKGGYIIEEYQDGGGLMTGAGSGEGFFSKLFNKSGEGKGLFNFGKRNAKMPGGFDPNLRDAANLSTGYTFGEVPEGTMWGTDELGWEHSYRPDNIINPKPKKQFTGFGKLFGQQESNIQDCPEGYVKDMNGNCIPSVYSAQESNVRTAAPVRRSYTNYLKTFGSTNPAESTAEDITMPAAEPVEAPAEPTGTPKFARKGGFLPKAQEGSAPTYADSLYAYNQGLKHAMTIAEAGTDGVDPAYYKNRINKVDATPTVANTTSWWDQNDFNTYLENAAFPEYFEDVHPSLLPVGFYGTGTDSYPQDPQFLKPVKPPGTTDPNVSVDVRFRKMGLDSSFANRKKIAQEMVGIEDYKGTSEQNKALNKWIVENYDPETKEYKTPEEPPRVTPIIAPPSGPIVTGPVEPITQQSSDAEEYKDFGQSIAPKTRYKWTIVDTLPDGSPEYKKVWTTDDDPAGIRVKRYGGSLKKFLPKAQGGNEVWGTAGMNSGAAFFGTADVKAEKDVGPTVAKAEALERKKESEKRIEKEKKKKPQYTYDKQGTRSGIKTDESNLGPTIKEQEEALRQAALQAESRYRLAPDAAEGAGITEDILYNDEGDYDWNAVTKVMASDDYQQKLIENFLQKEQAAYDATPWYLRYAHNASAFLNDPILVGAQLMEGKGPLTGQMEWLDDPAKAQELASRFGLTAEDLYGISGENDSYINDLFKFVNPGHWGTQAGVGIKDASIALDEGRYLDAAGNIGYTALNLFDAGALAKAAPTIGRGSARMLNNASDFALQNKLYNYNPLAVGHRRLINQPEAFYRQLDEATYAADKARGTVAGMPESMISNTKGFKTVDPVTGVTNRTNFNLGKSFGDDAYFNKGSLYYNNPAAGNRNMLYVSKLPEENWVGKVNNRFRSKDKTSIRVPAERGAMSMDDMSVYELNPFWGYQPVGQGNPVQRFLRNVPKEIDRIIYPKRTWRASSTTGENIDYAADLRTQALAEKVGKQGEFTTSDLDELEFYLRGNTGRKGLLMGDDMALTEYKVPFWKRDVSKNPDVVALKELQGSPVNKSEYIIPSGGLNKFIYPRKTTLLKAAPEHLTKMDGYSLRTSIPFSKDAPMYYSNFAKYLEDQMNAAITSNVRFAKEIPSKVRQEGGYVDTELDEDDINFLNFIGVRTEDI